MNAVMVQQHPASIDAYIRHGWSLCPVPSGTKGPTTVGWNIKENAVKLADDLPYNSGIGLLHAYSGTMALDIDDWFSTTLLFADHGIDLPALYDAPDAVIIDSGRQGHGKLLYAMPFGMTLPTKKVTSNGLTAYEFRCATSNGLSVQDVLPPSIHPQTQQPYRWAGKGNWQRLPTIPIPLLDLWQSLLSDPVQPTSPTTNAEVDWDEITSAVNAIDPDCSREEWIQVGMALHTSGQKGLQVWHDWSAKSTTKYPGERAINQQWNSFKSDKASIVKLGSLFHIARQHGWSKPTLDVSGMFPSNVITPDQLLEGLRAPVPNIDLDLFPPLLAKRANEVSEQIGCDPLVPLFSGLAAVCGVVDARIRLELMKGYKVPPVLWLMTIGAPADKKTPGAKPMMHTLGDLEREDMPRYAKVLKDWEYAEVVYGAADKANTDILKTAEFAVGVTPLNTLPPKPIKPVPLRIVVSDITSQKLVYHVSERPAGVLCHLDEMSSWIRKMSDTSSGDDRATWTQSYEANDYIADRVGTGSTNCVNFAVSIYGNVQPKVLEKNITSLTGDGLLQRFLFANLRGSYTKLGNPELPSNSEAWDNLIRLTHALPPMVYTMHEDAYTEYRDFQRWYEGAKRDERLTMAADDYMTAFGKFEGTAGRLCLLFHIIETPFNLQVSLDVVQRVVKLVKTYLIPSFRFTLGEVGGVDTLIGWLTDVVIQRSDLPEITLRDLKRAGKRRFEKMNTHAAGDLIIAAMLDLEAAQWVIRIDDLMKERQGVAVWAINPAIRDTFDVKRREIIAAKVHIKTQIIEASQSIKKPLVHGACDIGEWVG